MVKSGHERAEPGKGPKSISNEQTARRSGPEIDPDGVPTLRPVSEWLDHPREPPTGSDLPTTRWLQAVLRYSRADGSPIFGPIGRSIDRLKTLDAWANKLGDPSLSGVVVARWFPSRSASTAPSSTPPPLPSDSRPDRPLAILRSDWDPRGDLVAIDHRQAGDTSLLEVGSRGKTWLGPTWTSATIEGKFGRRPTDALDLGAVRRLRRVVLQGRSESGDQGCRAAPRSIDGPPRPAGRRPWSGQRDPTANRRRDRGFRHRRFKSPATLVGPRPALGQADPARPSRPHSTDRSRVDRDRRARGRHPSEFRVAKELVSRLDLLGKSSDILAIADRRLPFEGDW